MIQFRHLHLEAECYLGFDGVHFHSISCKNPGSCSDLKIIRIEKFEVTFECIAYSLATGATTTARFAEVFLATQFSFLKRLTLNLPTH